MKRIITLCILIFFSSGLIAAPKLSTTITGVSGDPLENAQKRTQHFIELHDHYRTNREIKRLFRLISNEIKKSLSPYGYFKPRVNSTLRWYNKQWDARYHIIPGPRVKVTAILVKVTGEGKMDSDFQRLIHHFPIKRGDPLNTPLYNKSKNTLLNMAASHGYFDAHMTESSIQVNTDNNTATIKMFLITGKRYQLGTVHFEQVNHGAKKLSYRFLQRFVRFKPGEPFNQKALFDLQEKLRLSHYFDHVSIKPDLQHQQHYRVPITVIVYASKAKHYQVGLGVGTDTGLRGTTGIKFRRLTSTGHYAAFNAKGTYKDTNLLGKANISYNIPGRHPDKDLYTFSAQAEQDQGDDFGITTNAKLALSYLTEFFGWNHTFSLGYQIERSRPVDEQPFSSGILIPSIDWLRVKSDDPIRPNYGYRLSANGRAASKAVLSDTSFVQGQIHGKWITTLGHSFRILTRGDLGMVGIDDITDLPLSLRFTAGGTQTIRGYGFRDIKDGRTMSIASLELQQRLYKNIYGAAFIDGGDIGPAFFADINRSVGLGLVWRSPIGAVELTIAKALDKPGEPSRLELAIGPEL